MTRNSAFARRSARRSAYTRWTAEALAKVSGNARTALVALTDDPQFDEPALDWALRTPAFYIGAAGSRQTHESRLQRFAELGFSTLDRARIHGLIGHSIGAMAPIEIAISIMAQITQAGHEGLTSMSSAEAPLASAVCTAVSAPLTLEDQQHARSMQLSKEGFGAGVVAGPPIDEVAEDEAAQRIAAALCGGLVHQTPANAGRSNLLATERGLVIASTDTLHAINAAHEGITVATLTPYATVVPGQTLATIKIIPQAVPEAAVRRCCEVAAAARPVLRVAPFGAKRVALIQTQTPTTRGTLLDKAVTATRARLAALGLDLSSTRICAHTVAAVIQSLRESCAAGIDIVLVLGAAATIDRDDVIPAALAAAGGETLHFGMPVEPGNPLLRGRLGASIVLGLSDCARSPKLNGLDWVLPRLMAGVEVSSRDIMRMGVGGLITGQAPLARRRETKKISVLTICRASARLCGGGALFTQGVGE